MRHILLTLVFFLASFSLTIGAQGINWVGFYAAEDCIDNSNSGINKCYIYEVDIQNTPKKDVYNCSCNLDGLEILCGYTAQGMAKDDRLYLFFSDELSGICDALASSKYTLVLQMVNGEIETIEDAYNLKDTFARMPKFKKKK